MSQRRARRRGPLDPRVDLDRLLGAFRLVSPVVLRMWSPHDRLCREMSAAGAEVLRRFGHTAKALGAAALVIPNVGDRRVVLGNAAVFESPNTHPQGAHAVIQSGGKLIDLTFGQVEAACVGITVPPSLFASATWGKWQWIREFRVMYKRDPSADWGLPSVASIRPIVDDLTTHTLAALDAPGESVAEVAEGGAS